jgi:hypothetical protein
MPATVARMAASNIAGMARFAALYFGRRTPHVLAVALAGQSRPRGGLPQERSNSYMPG